MKHLKEILNHLFDVLIVVEKEREIYFLDNVKIHLDSVKGLGFFVEIEVIDKDDILNKKEMEERCYSLMSFLGIEKENLVDKSYSDLLLGKPNSL